MVIRNILKYLPWLAIAVLLFLLFNSRDKGNKGSVTTVTKIKVEYVHDTFYVEVPGPTVTKTVVKEVPVTHKPAGDYNSLLIQYNALALDYFTEVNYSDTIYRDSSYVVADHKVSENSLQSSSYYFHLSYPVITKETVTTIIPEPRRQMFIGGTVGTSMDLKRQSIGAGLLYKNKKENMIGFDYSITTAGQSAVRVNSYFLINLKRK